MDVDRLYENLCDRIWEELNEADPDVDEALDKLHTAMGYLTHAISCLIDASDCIIDRPEHARVDDLVEAVGGIETNVEKICGMLGAL